MLICLFIFIQISFCQNSNVECKNSYCSECSSGYICTSCIENYILKENECHYKRELGCEAFEYTLEDYVCFNCSDGFKMNFETHKCEKGKEFCDNSELISKEQTKCSKCKERYTLGLKTCLDCKETNPYCLELDESDDCQKCKICQQGTELNSETGLCDIKNEFCLNFEENSQVKCKQCVNGYYLNSEGICMKGNIKGCHIYKNEEECDFCLNDGYVENNECIEGCESNNCLTCDPMNKALCKVCQQGYYLNSNNVCEKCGVDNCYYCKNDENTNCLVCQKNYFKTTNGSCIECDDTCEECNRNGCKKCKEGYYLNEEGICTACGEGCSWCEDKKGCIYCSKGYFKETNKNYCTVGKVDHCETYTSEGICTSCEFNYTVSDDNTCKACEIEFCSACSSDLKCTACLPGYYLDSNGLCSKCEGDCLYCYEKPDFCYECIEEGIKLPDLDDGKCYPNINECEHFYPNNTCKSCWLPYVLNEQGECILDNCKVRVDNKICLRCEDGYFMKDDFTCEKCDEKCGTCTHKSNECDVIEKSSSCLHHNENHECIECIEHYDLIDGKCMYTESDDICLRTFTGKCYVCIWKDYDENDEIVITYSHPNENFECTQSSEDDEDGFSDQTIIVFFVCLAILLILIIGAIAIIILVVFKKKKNKKTSNYKEIE